MKKGCHIVVITVTIEDSISNELSIRRLSLKLIVIQKPPQY